MTGLVTEFKTRSMTEFFRSWTTRGSELLHAARVKSDLAAAAGGRDHSRPRLSRPGVNARLPIGLAVCMAMLALLACLGGQQPPAPPRRWRRPFHWQRLELSGPLPQRRPGCVAELTLQPPAAAIAAAVAVHILGLLAWPALRREVQVGYELDDDRDRMDVDAIHDYLSRTRLTGRWGSSVRRWSCCSQGVPGGGPAHHGRQVGFCRAISDGAVPAS